MDFLVMGAGAVGSVVGGFLCLAGHRVFFLGRGDRIDTLMEKGLRLTGIWGDHIVPPVEAGRTVNDLLNSDIEPDWALLSVKSHDTRKALVDISPIISKVRGIVSLQNGLGNLESIADAASPEKTVAGRVIFGARMLEPGLVKVTVCADDLLLGPVKDEVSGLRDLCELIEAAGVPCRYEKKIVSYVWDKVIYNACLNALGTILDVTYGELADDSDTWYLMEEIVHECYRVAEATGVELISATAQDFLIRFKDELIPPTRDHRPSMREDIVRGKKTEIDALNGAIARLAMDSGLRAPVNETVARLIEFMERRFIHQGK